MALSEGFRGFVDMLKGTFVNPDEEIGEDDAFTFGREEYPVEDNLARKPQEGIDELYPTTSTPSSFNDRKRNRGTKVAPMPGYISNEVTVIEPRSFSESAQIVQNLIDKKTVILHLDLLDKEQSQRTIDFVCGASHALEGSVKKVSETVVIFAPRTVALSYENSVAQNKFTESLWKPL